MSTTPEVITDLIGNLIYARSGVYWLVEKRDQWSAALATWPEERIRTMTFALRMDEELKLPDAVALFETAETREELTLARWLTKSLIEVIDGEYPRDLWKWFNVLDFMRATHAPRT